jgi:hypothetical protein
MSEVVEEFPAVAGFKQKYPWDLWTDGRIHKLEPGVDFEVRPHRMVNAAFNHAKRNGYVVLTSTRGGHVYLQFFQRKSTGNPQRRSLQLPTTLLRSVG